MASRNNMISKLNVGDSKANGNLKKQGTVRTKKPSVSSKSKVNSKRKLDSENTEVSPFFQETSGASSLTRRVTRGKRTLELATETSQEIRNVRANRSKIPSLIARNKKTLGATGKTSADNQDIPESSTSSRNLRSTSRNKRIAEASEGTSQTSQENRTAVSRGRKNATNTSKRALVSGQTLSVNPKTPSRTSSKKLVAVSKKTPKLKRTLKEAGIASTSKGKTPSKGRPSKRQRTVEERSCVICLDTVRNSKFISTTCQHWFHNKCLNEWLATSTTCPTCRFVLKDPPPPPPVQPSSTYESVFGRLVQVNFSSNFSIDLASGIVTITISE